jgi:RNA polymerase sigma-70 factor (ECF subfamily)
VNTPSSGSARAAVEAAIRESYGRLIAFLCARTHDVAAAEDVLGEAVVAALATWTLEGVPQVPEAWLLTVARRRLIDRARHERSLVRTTAALEVAAADSYEMELPDPIPDQRLQLLFVCTHPAIDPDMHTPLMLQTVLGMDAARIARAFLVAPATMGQRLARAKTKIRHAGIAFEIPEARELPQRLGSVLSAIYAAYGNGWEDAIGTDPRARGLAEESIWLARVLRDCLPDEPEVRGLLALMLHCEARRFARRTPEGRYVPLSEQDPRNWIAPMIAEAERELAAAARVGRIGRFQLEAAIQSVHAERCRSGRTDWTAIADFYERLVQLTPSLGARVGRAAAVAEAHGAQAGLALLEEMDRDWVAPYQPYWAVRAHLLKLLQHDDEARQAFDNAIGLAEDEAVRRFLLERRNA